LTIAAETLGGRRQLADPSELVKFTLIYDGDLPASGSSPKPSYASNIRNAFHDQLEDLWNRDIIMRTLARTARTQQIHGGFWGSEKKIFTRPELPAYDGPIPSLQEGQTNFCAPISVTGIEAAFIPLVRHSLYLACDVDILFLRHDDDIKVIKRGGDLDNRIKTLFDALRMPSQLEELGGVVPKSDPLCVVLEDDALIHSFSVKTGKLLGQSIKSKHAVRLTIDVTVKVLRVFEQNQCLIGG
jgi:hypothetical protein